MREQAMNMENDRKNTAAAFKKNINKEAMTATTWRDLIPVIKIDICSVNNCQFSLFSSLGFFSVFIAKFYLLVFYLALV